jgi:hypothetical protein
VIRFDHVPTLPARTDQSPYLFALREAAIGYRPEIPGEVQSIGAPFPQIHHSRKSASL